MISHVLLRLVGLLFLSYGISYLVLPVLFVTWILTLGLMGLVHPLVGMAIPLTLATVVGLPEPGGASSSKRGRVGATAISLATAGFVLANFTSDGFGTGRCQDCSDSEVRTIIWSIAAPFLVLSVLSGLVAITGHVRLSRATVLFVAIIAGYVVLSASTGLIYALSYR